MQKIGGLVSKDPIVLFLLSFWHASSLLFSWKCVFSRICTFARKMTSLRFAENVFVR